MLQKSSIFETAELFFVYPTKEQYLMDISRKTGIAHTSIKKNLLVLKGTGLIKEEIQKKGARKFPVYKANLETKEYKKQKMLHNIAAVIQSGLIEHLSEKIMPKSIVIFGSYRRGEDTESSDIDIFIEAKPEQLDLKKYEKLLQRKIQLHFKEHFAQYPKELKNNIINGIVLYGFLEGYK